MFQGQPPPSYAASTSGETRTPGYGTITGRARGFYYFHRTKRGTTIFDAMNASGPRYYMSTAIKHESDSPDIMAYLSPDSGSSLVGQAVLSCKAKDFVIAVDTSARDSRAQQEVVEHVDDQKCFGTKGYHFTVPGAFHLTGEPVRGQTLRWRHIHNYLSVSPAWTSQGLELIDEATNQVLAVYLHMSETRNVTGRLQWMESCSFDEEIRALVVLITLLEKWRKTRSQAAWTLVGSTVTGIRKYVADHHT